MVRTKKALQTALWELLKEQPLSKITITEICKRAGVNRNTFYAHYKIPEDVAEEAFVYFFKELSRQANKLTMKSASNIICDFLERAKNDNGSSSLLDAALNNAEARSALLDAGKELYLEKWSEVASTAKIERAYRYISAGYIATVSDWLEKGAVEPVEDIAKDLAAMGMSAFHSIVPVLPSERE